MPTIPSRLALYLPALLLACSSSTPSSDVDMQQAEPDLAAPADLASPPDLSKPTMSFFITSRIGDGNLGGLTDDPHSVRLLSKLQPQDHHS